MWRNKLLISSHGIIGTEADEQKLRLIFITDVLLFKLNVYMVFFKVLPH